MLSLRPNKKQTKEIMIIQHFYPTFLQSSQAQAQNVQQHPPQGFVGQPNYQQYGPPPPMYGHPHYNQAPGAVPPSGGYGSLPSQGGPGRVVILFTRKLIFINVHDINE